MTDLLRHLIFVLIIPSFIWYLIFSIVLVYDNYNLSLCSHNSINAYITKLKMFYPVLKYIVHIILVLFLTQGGIPINALFK